jgi:hypothetical protein
MQIRRRGGHVTDHISFDGQTYESVDAMPPAVRAAYQDAISKLRQSSTEAAQLLDVARRISPDLLHREHSEHYLEAYRQAKRTASRVLTIALGLFVVGSIALGVWALWLLDTSAPKQEGGFSIGPGFLTLVMVTTVVGIALAGLIMVLKKRQPEDATAPGRRAPGVSNVLGALDRVEGVAGRVLQILLGVAAGGVVAGGYWMISNMDASSRSQAGEVYVGIGVLVALACIAAMYVSIEVRLKK